MLENVVIIALSVILSAIAFVLMIRDFRNENKEYKIDKAVIAYSVIMVALVVYITCLLQFKYDNHVVYNAKRMCLLAIMWPLAFIDFKTYRIPNEFVIMGLACRAIIVPFEFLLVDGQVMSVILADLVAAGALFLASVLCKLVIKDSIGVGDIKLFLVMGLMLGLDGIWSSIFMALIVSFFIICFLLLTKKKTRKDVIPFGPALVIGTFISVYFTGM